jgi:hypothetical protein
VTRTARKSKPPPRLSDEFRALEALAARGDPSLGQIVEALGQRGHALVIVFLTLPFAFPLPLWGISSVFGALIALTAVHMMLAGRLWLPRRWAARPVHGRTVRAVCRTARRLLARTERFIRPRGRFLHAHPGMARLNGLLVCLAALFLALPLPIPGTNLAPAWVILLICVGTLEQDGLLVALGYAAFAAGAGVASALVWPLLHWELVRGWWGG